MNLEDLYNEIGQIRFVPIEKKGKLKIRKFEVDSFIITINVFETIISCGNIDEEFYNYEETFKTKEEALNELNKLKKNN